MGVSKQEVERLKEERLGEVGYNKYNTKMKIVEYNSYNDIVVEFQDEHKARVHTGYGCFKKCGVGNPYDKTVLGIGYLGEGKYKEKINGKNTKVYSYWRHMLRRCYDAYVLNENISYIDCIVCKEWHNFQIFAQWFEENYYEVEGERMHLDKDILIKGNKIYSPDTCIIVPQRINSLFIKKQSDRGNCLIGVRWHKRDCVFEVRCKDVDCKQQYLGYFKDEYEAFMVYKQYKEKVIKQVADRYKNTIPKKLYDAMYRYEVEIND